MVTPEHDPDHAGHGGTERSASQLIQPSSREVGPNPRPVLRPLPGTALHTPTQKSPPHGRNQHFNAANTPRLPADTANDQRASMTPSQERHPR